MAWNDYNEIRCQFEFACPKSWDEMATTDDAAVRFCDHCQSRVYEAFVPADILRHRALGRCVSVRLASPEASASAGTAAASASASGRALAQRLEGVAPPFADVDPASLAPAPRLTGKVAPFAHTSVWVALLLGVTVPPLLLWLGVLGL